TRALIKEKIIAFLREEAHIVVDDLDDDAPLSHLGIVSLGIASIHCELEQATRKRVNPDAIYALDTIAELADYLDSLPIATLATKCASAHPPKPTALTHVNGPELPIDRDRLLDHYRLMNGRVQSLKDEGSYFFEPVISGHDGAWVVADGQRMLMLSSYEYL